MNGYNRFQGDPAIKIEPSGAKMKFIDGQPVMDQGFENAAIISLFTLQGYWGNDLTQVLSEKIGSDYEKDRVIIDVDTINDVTDAATLALQWFIDSGLASTIDIDVTNPDNKSIHTEVIIHPPGAQTLTELLFIKNGINWISQSKCPAHERF